MDDMGKQKPQEHEKSKDDTKMQKEKQEEETLSKKGEKQEQPKDGKSEEGTIGMTALTDCSSGADESGTILAALLAAETLPRSSQREMGEEDAPPKGGWLRRVRRAWSWFRGR